MRFEIVPYHAAGPVALGMARGDVRRLLGQDGTPFWKAPDDAEPSDEFAALGVVVYYAPPGRCEAVEFHGGDAEPVLAGCELLGRAYGDLRAWLEERDPDLRELPGVLISPRLGTSVWAPGAAGDPSTPVKSALAFARGYYDEETL